jgi:hypothetical protein
MEKNDKLQQIKELLKDYDKSAVNEYVNYVYKIHIDTNAKGELTSPWAGGVSAKKYADYFKIVNREGLYFDGIHITINKQGIQYDYIAYKNKMLLAYPESKIDIQLVYKGDDFKVAKETGKIIYSHSIGNPFDRKIEDIIGGYCIIENKRGEFITLLSKEEFDKHKEIARTKYIWNQWYSEMSFKTLFKKAIKIHFSDIYENIEKEDNKNYDLENIETPIIDEMDKYRKEIDEIKTEEDLSKYYKDNKEAVPDTKIFTKLLSDKKAELKSNENI